MTIEKGGIILKNSDFLNLLESFPGKTELQRSESIEEFVLEQAYIDFDDLFQKMKKRSFRVNIPKNEEIWFKFLSFMVIFDQYCDNIPKTKEFLDLTSQKILKKICCQFDKCFCDGDNIISDVRGIHPDELIEFAKRGEALL